MDCKKEILNKIKKITIKWSKYEKERYYFKNGYLKKSNAYLTFDENDIKKAKFVYKYKDAYICINTR